MKRCLCILCLSAIALAALVFSGAGEVSVGPGSEKSAQTNSATGATDMAGTLPAGAVKVEIIEGLPDEMSWKFSPPPAAESYTELAFGFPAVPNKYSNKGIKTDRAVPFLLRATARVTLPEGEHRLLLRARTGARLSIDGTVLTSTKFPNLNADGHEEVPEAPAVVAPDLRYPPPGHVESLTNFHSDGQSHVFVMEALVGTKGRRPELGELTVSLDSGDGIFRLLSPKLNVPYTDDGWTLYETQRRSNLRAMDKKRRQVAAAEEDKYWTWRHELARQQLQRRDSDRPAPKVSSSSVHNDIDRFIGARLEAAQVKAAPLVDDYSFLRRVSLDTIGRLPAAEEIERFMADKPARRRAAAIDRLLNHPGWADHWVSYWQDVLAENPGILKPMLNNTGPVPLVDSRIASPTTNRWTASRPN